MKKGIVSDTFYPEANGVSVYLTSLTKELVHKGHHVMVYTHSHAKSPMKGCQLVKIPSAELKKYPNFYVCKPNPVKMFNRMRKDKLDIIHVHAPSPVGMVARYVGFKENIPCITTFNGFLDHYYEYLSISSMLKLERLVSSINSVVPRSLKMLVEPVTRARKNMKRDAIWKGLKIFHRTFPVTLVPSEKSRRVLKKYGIKAQVMPYAVDLSMIKPKKSYKKTNNILTISRMGKEKNLDMLLKAFALLDKKFQLTIVGDGPYRKELEKRATTLEIKNRVTFTGMKKRSDYNNYFSTHDIFVNPSTSETFGIVTLEAMAGGLPIVGMNVQGTADLVDQGKNGFLAKKNSAESLANTIKKLTNKPLARFGKQSYNSSQKFSIEKSVDAHVKLYNQLLKSSKKF